MTAEDSTWRKGDFDESDSRDLEGILELKESFGRLNDLGFARVDFPGDTAVYMVGNVEGEIVVYRNLDYDAVTRESLRAVFTQYARMFPRESPASVAAGEETEQTDEDFDAETDF